MSPTAYRKQYLVWKSVGICTLWRQFGLHWQWWGLAQMSMKQLSQYSIRSFFSEKVLFGTEKTCTVGDYHCSRCHCNRSSPYHSSKTNHASHYTTVIHGQSSVPRWAPWSVPSAATMMRWCSRWRRATWRASGSATGARRTIPPKRWRGKMFQCSSIHQLLKQIVGICFSHHIPIYHDPWNLQTFFSKSNISPNK